MNTIAAAAGTIPGRNTRTSERGGTGFYSDASSHDSFRGTARGTAGETRLGELGTPRTRRPAQRDLQLVSEVEAATSLSGPLEESSGATHRVRRPPFEWETIYNIGGARLSNAEWRRKESLGA